MDTVDTSWGEPVEVAVTTTGLAPNDNSGLSLNSTSVWYRLTGQRWQRSIYKSKFRTKRAIGESSSEKDLEVRLRGYTLEKIDKENETSTPFRPRPTDSEQGGP